MEPLRNAREASLLQAFRRLPPDAAAEPAALAERLAALRADAKIDWSDSWSDEDLKEFSTASARRLETEDPDEPRLLGILTTKVPAPIPATDHPFRGPAIRRLRAPSCFRAYVLTIHRPEPTVIGHLSDQDWNRIQACVRAAFSI